MSEIKFNLGVSNEISSLTSSGVALNNDFSEISADSVSTLDTAVKYIDQHGQIAELLNLYKQLIIKDASDLSQTMETVSTTDLLLSNNLNLTIINNGGQK